MLDYDPETGVFVWKVTRGPRAPAGSRAGYVNNRVRWRVCVDGDRILMHRVAFALMTGEWPTQVIDHINQNPLDNRWSNLRDVSKQANAYNSKINKNNSSGFRGVVYDKARSRWTARIKVFHKTFNLGRFESIEEAIQARVSAEREHGVFIYQK